MRACYLAQKPKEINHYPTQKLKNINTISKSYLKQTLKDTSATTSFSARNPNDLNMSFVMLSVLTQSRAEVTIWLREVRKRKLQVGKSIDN